MDKDTENNRDYIKVVPSLRNSKPQLFQETLTIKSARATAKNVLPQPMELAETPKRQETSTSADQSTSLSHCTSKSKRRLAKRLTPNARNTLTVSLPHKVDSVHPLENASTSPYAHQSSTVELLEPQLELFSEKVFINADNITLSIYFR